jgi:GAF domain-containing protein
MLNTLLTAIAIGGLLVMGVTFVSATSDPSQWPAVLFFLAGYVFVVILAVFRRLPWRFRSLSTFVIGYGIAIMAFARGGLVGVGPLYLLALPILGVILLGSRSSMVMLALSLVIFIFFAVANQLNWLTNWMMVLDPLSAASWLDKGTDFTMLLVGLVALQWLFSRSQIRALRTSRKREAELNETRVLLEEKVREAERHARQLEGIARVSRDATALLNPDDMLQRAVESIKEQFDFEMVSVYLSDESHYQVDLRAIAGAPPEAGQHPAMIRAVGQMMHSGARRILRSDVRPGRLALLLKARGRTIGVLAIQARVDESEGQDVFYDEDISVLQMMADQIAIAVENARLFEETQASLQELNALYRQYAAEAWKDYKLAKPEELRYSCGDMTCPSEIWSEARDQAWASGKAVTFTGDCAGETAVRSLAVPVDLHGVTIGVMAFHRPAEAEAWRPEEIAIVNMVADRLAMAVENIRLLEAAQRNAARERRVSEVTDKMRRAVNMDDLMQTTVKEVAEVMEVSGTFVQLGVLPTHSTEDADSREAL